MNLLNFRGPCSLASRTEPATYLSLSFVKLHEKYKKMTFRERASFLFVSVDFVSEIAFGTHSYARNRESINRHKNRSSVDKGRQWDPKIQVGACAVRQPVFPPGSVP